MAQKAARGYWRIWWLEPALALYLLEPTWAYYGPGGKRSAEPIRGAERSDPVRVGPYIGVL